MTSHGNFWCILWLIWIEGAKTATKYSIILIIENIIGVTTPPHDKTCLKKKTLSR